jgi:hypothetical protein
MPVSREELRRLHFINTLFAEVTGNDLYLAQQISQAIAFSLPELEAQTASHPERAAPEADAFAAAAALLLERLFLRPDRGFFHWDARRTLLSATPLFARSEIMVGLKRLARYQEATFLVTNLRPALLPPERRETNRRRQEYEETLAYIRELIAARIAPRANVQLIFL